MIFRYTRGEVLRVSFIDLASRHGARLEVDKQCSFCLRELARLEYLVTAPAVSICSGCVGRCVKELKDHRVGGWRRWWDLRSPKLIPDEPTALPYRASDLSCSFCRLELIRDTIAAENARICSPCVRIAADLVPKGRDRSR